MLSTIAFCRLSIADSLMVAESTATTTMIHTCAAAAILVSAVLQSPP